VLDSLRRQLHKEFAIVGVESGVEALALLNEGPPFAVLMSDMRMPGLDGAAVLEQARSVQPDTVRVLLTGQADIDDAIAAVNDGNIFRFLVKPCPRPVLLKALSDAVSQHRMITAERELLELTLRGSVAALLETLSVANPVAFARAARIQQIVRQMIEATAPENAWCIEIAAMLSQIGTVVLAPSTLAKLNSGTRLTPEEELQVRVIPWHAERLLAHVPRLEVVRQIIHDQAVPYERCEPAHPEGSRSGNESELVRTAATGAQILRVAVDLEALESGGAHRHAALTTMGRRLGSYDPTLLKALLASVELEIGDADALPLLTLMVNELKPGMTIARDVTDSAGRLLVGRGYKVTESLMERIRNWKMGSAVREPIYVSSE
jgi:CheY-like chemotaxis protein